MLYLVKTTTYYCKSRDLVWDPRKDILFLCQHYGREVEAVRGHLNVREIQENFLGTPFFSRLPPEEQKRCYQVLLGKDPPPAMSITPPPPPAGHRPSASASDIPRPRIPSHKSSPSLNNALQQQTGLLSPPLPGRPKKQSAAPAGTVHSQSTAPSAPRPQVPPETANAQRDSRSRYRSSAPSTPSVTRNVSPEQNTPAAAPRPKSMDMRPSHQQPTGPLSKPHAVGPQNFALAPKPHMAAGNAPGSQSAPQMAMRPQQSMPNINQRSSGAVPIFAHGQSTSQAAPRVPNMPPQGKAAAFPPMPTTSTRIQPKGVPPGVPLSAPSNIVPAPLAPKNVPPTQTSTPAKASLHNFQQATSAYGSHANRSMLSNAHAEMNNSGARSLKVVGPEGLYSSPPQPLTQPARNQPPANGPRGMASKPSTFVFELDASSPQTASVPKLQNVPQGFIAELPAESEVPRPAAEPISNRSRSYTDKQPSPLESGPCLRDSPVSPPVDSNPIPVPAQPPQPEQQSHPTPSWTQSAPLESLPPSLMVGAHGPPRRSPQNSISQPPPQPANPPPSTSQYQRYYSPPSSAPSSAQHSPKQTPASTYKAYSGPISPPTQPAPRPTKLQKPPSMAHIQASMATLQPPPSGPTPPQANSAPLPPNGLRAGPHKTPQHPFPNPLGAHPPTPPTIPSLPKSAPAPAAPTAYTAYAYHPPADPGYLAFASPPEHPAPRDQSYFTYAGPTTASAPAVPGAGPVLPAAAAATTGHQRSTSHDSQASNASHDSAKLAQEYQMDLPDFEHGYGKVREGLYAGEGYADFT